VVIIGYDIQHMNNLVNRVQGRIRRHTHILRSTPHFIILGGMKCGSTALYQYLIQHPDIVGASVKEVHFFDNRFDRGLSWYRKHFPLKASLGSRLTGEASPSYIFHPAVAERIKLVLPDVKLIVLLRNPVDRAYSHYHHTLRKGYEKLSFKDAIESEPERLNGERERILADASYRSPTFAAFSYVTRGIYWEQLERYYQHFDRSQILVLKSEDLFYDPQSVTNRVSAFLGLESFRLKDPTPKNKASYVRKITATHEQLYAFYRPHNEKLYQLIGETYDWDDQYA